MRLFEDTHNTAKSAGHDQGQGITSDFASMLSQALSGDWIPLRNADEDKMRFMQMGQDKPDSQRGIEWGRLLD